MNKTYTIVLDEAQLNQVLNALMSFPYREVAVTVHAINSQATVQSAQAPTSTEQGE